MAVHRAHADGDLGDGAVLAAGLRGVLGRVQRAVPLAAAVAVAVLVRHVAVGLVGAGTLVRGVAGAAARGPHRSGGTECGFTNASRQCCFLRELACFFLAFKLLLYWDHN